MLVLDENKSDATDSTPTIAASAFIASGAVGILIVLVVLIGIILWKRKKNRKENLISNQGNYFRNK